MTKENNRSEGTEGGEEANGDKNGEQPRQPKREKTRKFVKSKNREDYEYEYKTVSITLNHDEEAKAKKALQIAKNHYTHSFTRVQLNTIQSFIKAIGFMYFDEFIAEWEKSQKKNGGGKE